MRQPAGLAAQFSGPLLWRRAEGELLQAVRHGMQDAQGRATMPGFAAQLSVPESWALLHFLRAQAAGQLLRATGSWAQPIALPDMPLRCHRPDKLQVRDWQGQRLRVVSSARVQDVAPDPRMVTLWLPQPGQDAAHLPDHVDCAVTSGRPRCRHWAGSMRANPCARCSCWRTRPVGCGRATAGARKAGAMTICCAAPRMRRPLPGQTEEDGLTRILRRMDAEPLGYVQGGRVHGGR
jgi:hypothetical protein